LLYEIMISPGFLSGLLMGLAFPGLCSCCFHHLPVGICIRGTDALLRFIQHTEQGIFAVRPGKPVQAAMLPVRGGSFLTPVFRGIAGGRMGCFSARLHSGRKFLKSAYGKPHGFEMFRDAAMIIADKSENKPI
jgi:hypothetical protein